jgi:hypothetical protein
MVVLFDSVSKIALSLPAIDGAQDKPGSLGKPR